MSALIGLPEGFELSLMKHDWPFIKEVKEVFKGHIQALQVKVVCHYDPAQDALRFVTHFHWHAQKKLQVECLKTFYGTDRESMENVPTFTQEYLHPGSVYFGCLIRILEAPFLKLDEQVGYYTDAIEGQFRAHKAEIVKLITNKSVYGTEEEPKWDQLSQSADSLAAEREPSETSLSETTDSSKSPSLVP